MYSRNIKWFSITKSSLKCNSRAMKWNFERICLFWREFRILAAYPVRYPSLITVEPLRYEYNRTSLEKPPATLENHHWIDPRYFLFPPFQLYGVE